MRREDKRREKKRGKKEKFRGPRHRILKRKQNMMV